MMNNKKFSRECPDCKKLLFYANKSHCNFADKQKSLCRPCSIKKITTKPKEKFTCYTCSKEWEDWRSQISNPETPFCSKQCWYNSQLKSLVGQRFGRLSVLDRVRRNQTTFYICQCDCGKSVEVTHTNLSEGRGTSSCGCYLKDIRKKERKPIKEVVNKSIFGSYKRNSKNRNYEWELPYDKFVDLINGNCYYCNSEPNNTFTWRYKYETITTLVSGIDRVDNTIGYTITNCVSCCRTCNSAKGELNIHQFKEWAMKLVANFPDCKLQ